MRSTILNCVAIDFANADLIGQIEKVIKTIKSTALINKGRKIV